MSKPNPRLADEGELLEKTGDYTFYWKGKSSTEKHESGVGFAIRNCLTKKSYWNSSYLRE